MQNLGTQQLHITRITRADPCAGNSHLPAYQHAGGYHCYCFTSLPGATALTTITRLKRLLTTAVGLAGLTN